MGNAARRHLQTSTKASRSSKRRMAVHDLRDKLRNIGAGPGVFCRRSRACTNATPSATTTGPVSPQYEFPGRFDLERFLPTAGTRSMTAGHPPPRPTPILRQVPDRQMGQTRTFSMHRAERRGLLPLRDRHSPAGASPLHCVNVHLGLLGHWRKKNKSCFLKTPNRTPGAARGPVWSLPAIFNDWRRTRRAMRWKQSLNVSEVFRERRRGRPARSLSRHCCRFLPSGPHFTCAGFRDPHRSCAPWARAWSRVSDHIALSALLTRKA